MAYEHENDCLNHMYQIMFQFFLFTNEILPNNINYLIIRLKVLNSDLQNQPATTR